MHFVKTEVTAYEIVLTKGGPKFEAAIAKPHLTNLSESWDVVMGRVHLKARQSMSQLACFLTFFLDKPVVDATGLSGVYNIALTFGASAPWLRGPGALFPADGPPLTEALHDQLGLALERTKSSVDVLVIDRIEKKPAAR